MKDNEIIDKVGESIVPELVIENNMEINKSEQKRIEYTKISYEAYKERTQLKIEVNDVLTLEETRYDTI